MPFLTRTFVYGLMASTLPLISSASGLMFARATDDDVDPDTGSIVAHIESLQSIKWVTAADGSKYADFDNNAWNNATQHVKAAQLTSRLAVRGQSANPAARALSTLQRRSSGGKLDGGMDPGDGKKHHAFFSCYNSGQASYTNVLSLVSGVGCGAIFNGIQHVGTRVWVSKEYWTPNHKVMKVFLTVLGQGLNLASAAECSWAVGWVISKFCQIDANTQTQGGKLHVYRNENSAWTNGAEIGTIKVDPNTCSKDIPCGTPDNIVP